MANYKLRDLVSRNWFKVPIKPMLHSAVTVSILKIVFRQNWELEKPPPKKPQKTKIPPKFLICVCSFNSVGD